MDDLIKEDVAKVGTDVKSEVEATAVSIEAQAAPRVAEAHSVLLEIEAKLSNIEHAVVDEIKALVMKAKVLLHLS